MYAVSVWRGGEDVFCCHAATRRRQLSIGRRHYLREVLARRQSEHRIEQSRDTRHGAAIWPFCTAFCRFTGVAKSVRVARKGGNWRQIYALPRVRTCRPKLSATRPPIIVLLHMRPVRSAQRPSFVQVCEARTLGEKWYGPSLFDKMCLVVSS